MRAFCLSVLFGLSQWAALSFAEPFFRPPTHRPTPISPPQYCANSPDTVAGTVFSRRSVPNLSTKRQVKPVIWCAGGTQTYVTITLTSPFPAGPQISALYSSLTKVDFGVRGQLSVAKDGVIGHSVQYIFGPVDAQTWDAGGHQTTWGVLGAVYKALLDFVQYFSINGGMNFDIHDGLNQVGSGSVTWVGA